MRLSNRLPNGRRETPLANRRGMAIIVTLILTVALGALALSAVYLASSTKIGSGLSNRAADLQYAADAALQMGKSYINADPDAMPATGYREITFNGGVLRDAGGTVIPGVSVRVWAGPTGATTGQFGAFGSVIAEAQDATGAKVVRRLELAQENFARFAYWSNKENRSGTPLWFNGGDVIVGPTWSNDTLRIALKGALPFAAQFRDVVGTASIVIQPGEAEWWKGYTENMTPIALPAVSSLSNLAAYATSGRMNLTAPTGGDEKTVRMRIEFVNFDIDNDGSSLDPQDGFFRVYDLNGPGLTTSIRADSAVMRSNCGEWISVPTQGDRFYTVQAHGDPLVRTYIYSKFVASGMAVATATTLMNRLNFRTVLTTPMPSLATDSIMSRNGTIPDVPAGNRSQCYLGGAPELNTNWNGVADYGGNALTIRVNSAEGDWLPYGGVIDPRVTAKVGAAHAAVLFPLHRSINTGARGVIHVNGTVGISGMLVGRVTLRTTGSIVVLDDVRYGTNPTSSGRCVDVLGLLAEKDVVVADNMLQNQTDVNWSAATNWRTMDDTKDVTIHSVVMALDMSFRVEDYNQGRTSGNPCIGSDRGRGCLYLLGGIIQEARGAVTQFGGGGGTGFVKQYNYDRCANLRPPPYFPTTGRYLDNRYMEVDPVTFNISTLMARLTPAP